MGHPDWLRVDGDRLVDGSGRTVRLAGVGLGGWLNMENFITGYPATESQQRTALRAALGEQGYQRFFDRFLTDFFDAPDAEYLASLGLNSVRVPFSYRHFEDDSRPFELREEGFRWLDRVVGACARAGLYTILDLHAVPGYQNQDWHSDNPTHRAMFWQHRHFQDRVVHLWEAIADHYRDEPAVAGYNPVNEPADPSGAVIGPFYERLERAIRLVDTRHVLFLDGNRYSTDFSAFTDPFPNTVYTAHDYALPGIAAEGEYPGTTRGEWFDRTVLEQTFLRRTEFMRRTGTPIWIGEFGPVYPTTRPSAWLPRQPDLPAAGGQAGTAGTEPGAVPDPTVALAPDDTAGPAPGGTPDDGPRYRILRDQLDIYQDHGASWALWTYKDIGLQGLVYARPDSPYLQRIAPVLARKERLGVDAWGGMDHGVRDILDPIEALISREFADFAPYPWGGRQWAHRLIRHILLAEPLVDEFGRRFVGVGPDEAERLAASFAFGACARREPLATLLRDHLAEG